MAMMGTLTLSAQSVYDFKVTNDEGNEVSLDKYKGKVLLIVNTATRCGFTPQYKELEELYKKYQVKGKNPSKRFVMRPELYSPIQEKKVFAEASTHSGISAGVIKAAWDAAGAVIRTWATDGHSVPVPGLGTMRFGVRAKAVENLDDVKTGLISVRRIIFTPNVDVKDELKNTSIQITCLDEDGKVLKRVTSGDSGDIEDNENGGGTNEPTNGGNTGGGGNESNGD